MGLKEDDLEIEFRTDLMHINADVLSRMDWTPHDTADDAFIQGLEEAIIPLPDRPNPPPRQPTSTTKETTRAWAPWRSMCSQEARLKWMSTHLSGAGQRTWERRNASMRSWPIKWQLSRRV